MPHHHRLHKHDKPRVQLAAECGPRELLSDLGCDVVGSTIAEELRQAGIVLCDAQVEVSKNSAPVLADKHVVTLNVSLDEAVLVQHVDRSQDAEQNSEEGGEESSIEATCDREGRDGGRDTTLLLAAVLQSSNRKFVAVFFQSFVVKVLRSTCCTLLVRISPQTSQLAGLKIQLPTQPHKKVSNGTQCSLGDSHDVDAECVFEHAGECLPLLAHEQHVEWGGSRLYHTNDVCCVGV